MQFLAANIVTCCNLCLKHCKMDHFSKTNLSVVPYQGEKHFGNTALDEALMKAAVP